MWGWPPHAFVFRGFVIVVDATVDDNYVAFSKLIVDFPFVCNLIIIIIIIITNNNEKEWEKAP